MKLIFLPSAALILAMTMTGPAFSRSDLVDDPDLGNTICSHDPGCNGTLNPVDPPSSRPSRPARGVFACYVRSSAGKLYGPGPERSSQAAARSAALNRCASVTRSKCATAYCSSF